MKGVMVDQSTEDLNGDGWRATWHNTKTSLFDSKRFKADHADVYATYTVRSSGTRFTLNRLNA